MQALWPLVTSVYRRFLADFLPGFLLIVALWAGGLFETATQNTPSLTDWKEPAVIVILSFPLSIMIGYISWALFYGFCWQTEFLSSLDKLLSLEYFSNLSKKELESLKQKLSWAIVLPQDLEETLHYAVRNVLRGRAPHERTVEHIERLDGITSLLRSLALVGPIYVIIELLRVSPQEPGFTVPLLFGAPWISAPKAGLIAASLIIALLLLLSLSRFLLPLARFLLPLLSRWLGKEALARKVSLLKSHLGIVRTLFLVGWAGAFGLIAAPFLGGGRLPGPLADPFPPVPSQADCLPNGLGALPHGPR